MAKEKGITVNGTVVEELGCARFRIQLENGEFVIATASKLAHNNIRINVDDHIMVEISPYDLERGRILYRYK